MDPSMHEWKVKINIEYRAFEATLDRPEKVQSTRIFQKQNKPLDCYDKFTHDVSFNEGGIDSWHPKDGFENSFTKFSPSTKISFLTNPDILALATVRISEACLQWELHCFLPLWPIRGHFRVVLCNVSSMIRWRFS
jgi:hypothetical protein